MDSGTDNRDEHSNAESWIEFGETSPSEGSIINEPTTLRPPSPTKAASLTSSSVERLLLEAQKESSCASSVYNNSRESSQESPKSVHSPASELNINADANSQGSNEARASNWVLNWSSRPEIVPPSDLPAAHDTNHAAPKRHRLSIRNTRVMRGILFVVEHLPVLIVTHACSFLLGAVTVVVYLKKSRRWSSVPLAVVNG
jgi:BCL2/adenovirus E1B protein-interacting protein 3